MTHSYQTTIRVSCVSCLLFLFGCDTLTSPVKLFTLVPPEESGVYFNNEIYYNESFNPFTFHNLFNGGGVAAGDINNDGLVDLFFCSNLGSNKLYLNKGNFQFEDISARAGISTQGIWYTGVTFVDINSDGLLDVYLCRSADFEVGWRGNELYINQGDLTFEEKAAEYGLHNVGFSTHAAFFDYDNDGDLDCYLLNNSNRSGSEYYNLTVQRKIPDPKGGNKLYRNDDQKFVEVTQEAGIYGSMIGFGLGVTIADINKDNWLDIYVSNDFFERDYLYINNKNGGFDESLEEYVREISMFSMGADIADINNDGYVDIYVTDMLPEEESRVKTKTNFENWDKYQKNKDKGFYEQFLRNTLQLNRGPVWSPEKKQNEYHFSEIGRLAGVHATDWSWGALIADLDNDGLKDIFVANGMYKDVTDQDFIQFLAEDPLRDAKNSFKTLVDMMPSYPLANYVFRNNGDLSFSNYADQWGMGHRGFSNGSLYADLDNDGDLDIVTNNINAPASLYKNNAESLLKGNNYLKTVLIGAGKNTMATGTKVTLYYGETVNYQEAANARGFQSSVDSRLNFGLGKTSVVDSLEVVWPGGSRQVLLKIAANQTLQLRMADAVEGTTPKAETQGRLLFETVAAEEVLNFRHQEDVLVDFKKDPLIYYMLSTEGPKLAAADLNGDLLEDVYIGGAKGQPGSLFFQVKPGAFVPALQPAFEIDSLYEDTDALFADVDNDGDLDLVVTSGGNVYSASHPFLADRLYLNDGKGKFTRAAKNLPENTSLENSATVVAADYDLDGDMDLFIGNRLVPGHYGLPASGQLLQNTGDGNFIDVTSEIAPFLLKAGMITDAVWIDYNNNQVPDLLLVGEYMPVSLFENTAGRFEDITALANLSQTNGWWNTLKVADLNGDGYPDVVAGNHGTNSRFKASQTTPVSLYVNDFDRNGTIEQIVCTYNGDKQYPMVLRHDLVNLLPALKKKYLKYENYKEQQITDIFTSEQLEGAVRLEAYEMKTAVFLNDKKGGFKQVDLPVEAQFSPVHAIAVNDFNKDGKQDILLGGNFYEAKPEAGIHDASYGQLLQGDGQGYFSAVPMPISNLLIKGPVRDFCILESLDENYILVSVNDSQLQVLKYGQKACW